MSSTPLDLSNMTSIDIKDKFFSVPIHSTHQKNLKFTFDDLLQFTCMPNRYRPATGLC